MVNAALDSHPFVGAPFALVSRGRAPCDTRGRVVDVSADSRTSTSTGRCAPAITIRWRPRTRWCSAAFTSPKKACTRRWRQASLRIRDRPSISHQ